MYVCIYIYIYILIRVPATVTVNVYGDDYDVAFVASFRKKKHCLRWRTRSKLVQALPLKISCSRATRKSPSKA